MMKTKHKVGHMLFELFHDKVDGAWWTVQPVSALEKKDRKVLFSGPVEKLMAEQLRSLAIKIKELEPIDDVCGECGGSGWIGGEEFKRVSGEYQAYEPVDGSSRCERCNPLGV
jgi:hypothetical protein